MLYAKDFRERAYIALQNNWGWAVLTGFVGGFLGAATTLLDGGSGGSNISEEEMEVMASNPFGQVILAFLGIMMMVVLVWSIVLFIIGGPITLGYAQYNLNLVDGNNPQFADLFSKFDQFGQGFLVQFLRHLYIILWAFLFIIPGIVKSYSYSMTAYIAAENPDMTANEAITASKELMDGNKGRLFCLDLSFIGWWILCIFTLGIGFLFLKPYREAAFASFYREIVRERMPEPVPTQTQMLEENPYYPEY